MSKCDQHELGMSLVCSECLDEARRDLKWHKAELARKEARVSELEAALAKANQRLVTADWDAVIQERERCINRLLELVPMTDPDLTTGYLREELAK